MKDTKIRWADNTWNAFTGCDEVSPGCDHCYARVIAEKFAGGPAWPEGFAPMYRPHRLNEPAKWQPGRVFVNSMSDMHHPAFTTEQVDSVYDKMLEIDKHQYLILTKRPKRMAAYMVNEGGWLERHGLYEVPSHIWLGASIESDQYTFRANHLRRIPVRVRFLSCEPLLGPLPSLDLDGIGWVIVGGESGPGFRPMEHAWAGDIRDRCLDADVPFYFKQSAAYRTEVGQLLEGERWEQYPANEWDGKLV